MGATDNANILPSDTIAILDAIDPDSIDDAAAVTAWIDMGDLYRAMAIVQVGDMVATSTVNAKLQQATDASGTGAKDITGKAITAMTAAGSDDDKQAIINLNVEEMDMENDFTHIQFSITGGVAAVEFSGLLLGLSPRHGPADKLNAATVDEIVT